MKVKIKDVEFREDLYPRIEFSQKLVENYSNAIKFLPPVTINQDNILIDGWHRWKAHKMANKDEIEVEIIRVESEKELRKLAYKLNSNHGLQLSNKEKSNFANEMIGEISAKELAEVLSVDVDTIFLWTKTKRHALKEVRNERVIRLYLKAENSLDSIAKEVGESQGTISNIIQSFIKESEFQFFNEDFKPLLYDIWRPKEDVAVPHSGYFPEVFMVNLLYYHTELFDVIYDPFANRGTTIDIAKKCFRRYYCSDLVVKPGREGDIKQWKIQDGLPVGLKGKKTNLVFLNLPLWIPGKEGQTGNKYNLANMNLEDYYSTIGNFLKNITIKRPDRIAIVISPTQYFNEDDKKEFEDHIFKFDLILGKLKYKIEMRYILIYPIHLYDDIVGKFKEKKVAISIVRDLVVWVRMK